MREFPKTVINQCPNFFCDNKEPILFLPLHDKNLSVRCELCGMKIVPLSIYGQKPKPYHPTICPELCGNKNPKEFRYRSNCFYECKKCGEVFKSVMF